jgi:hypothetical protein
VLIHFYFLEKSEKVRQSSLQQYANILLCSNNASAGEAGVVFWGSSIASHFLLWKDCL